MEEQTKVYSYEELKKMDVNGSLIGPAYYAYHFNEFDKLVNKEPRYERGTQIKQLIESEKAFNEMMKERQEMRKMTAHVDETNMREIQKMIKKELGKSE